MTTALKETIGRYGIWSVGLRSEDPDRRGELAEAAAELEELGYGAVWLGGNSSAANAAPLIEATSRLTVGTSIQSIWQHEPDAAATAFAELESAHPGRFLLGLGVSHAKRVEQYARPYSALVEHLDGLDAAGVPADRRLLAALGPKSLRLARDRAAGSIPYLVTPEHTAHARDLLGEGPLLAPELGVVPETDPTRARALAREFLGIYLPLQNYTNNFLRHGFTEDDLTDGGSDRLVDALFAWGDDTAIRAKIDTYFEAGADHIALQLINDEPRDALPRKAWRDLAAVLN
ncbi:LLM class F420-dependent oxidoreductase [Streptomyces violaceus]|uniref:LLM class F420-dependent oxidoreductase n=1 Tax=Streptomyces violaceus TaxID=1936 RepID=A0ABY9UEP9_STRVL|nr:LLM class F420-dependent oxidoreductase [Streptomyces janthinus]WND20681.1 LLM class F420-dependent oxidoreductase [Streptomyces janthinus]GGS51365.1 LLM class F420-dependent oxidoreductase [Streptomyces janthinus]